jgi:YD repeat-containing protein
MLLANKHFTPVIGIDVHIVVIPPGVPTPMPHPFIGMVLDPADYIPFIGSTVNVNYTPRGNSGTSGVLGTMVHIPMGGPFAMAPMIGHDSMNFFGSTRVSAEGSYMSPSGYMLMTCNDLGMPLSLSPGKKMKPVPSLYLPTSSTIPIPGGKPVMVGGPYAPDLIGMLTALVMSYGMGALMKGLGKGMSKALKALNKKLLKKFDCTQGLSSKLCKMGFEPVDLITGRMVYEGEDFNLPGIIPLSWKRSWYSDSKYQGLMGYGCHNNYDVSLHIEKKEDAIIMMLPDGRATVFPRIITKEESYYHRSEKLTLTFLDKNTYTVKDHASNLTYTFKKLTETVYKPIFLGNKEAFIEFNYDAAHNLSQIIDTVGREINLQLDSSGRVTKITASHKGQYRTLINYAYNADGDLIEITDALNQTTKMEYINHLMVKKTDRNGQAFYWEYDGKTTGAKCIKTWGDGGILSGTIQYGKNQNIVTNSLGEETIYYFNDDNLCTQVTNPLGDNIYHEYTEFMEPYRDIDEEGNLTGYSYDSRGNLTGLHQPDGSVVTFVYDEEDRLILTKNPEGDSSIRVYENDKLHATIDPAGAVTSFKYDENGLMHSVINEAGNKTLLEYDEDFNLSGMRLANGTKSIWKYDEWGRCTQIINSEQHKQHFFYDELDRIEKIQQADKNTITLKYNAYDEVIKTSDSKKRNINFEYTPLGSLKTREENGRKVHFKYNTEEQLLAITNEHNEYYRFGRNANGNIINETGFDGLRRDYLRDRAGKVLKVNRPDDRFTEYEYDINGRITRAEHHDGTWETYSYDRNGNLIEAVNQHTQVQFIRDDAGRIIKEIQDGHEVESEYNSSSLRTKITSSLGANINLKHDTLGLLKDVTASVNTETETKNTWSAKLSYNSLGQEVERVLPGGIINTMEYDFAGRPLIHKVSHANKELMHRTYTWNVNDQLHKMVNHLTNGVVNFGYDDFGNLASARYEDQQFDYKLPDEVGNLYRTKGKGDREYGKGGQLLKANGNTYKYDAEGNLITKITNKGKWDYTWYGNGMLKSVIKPDNKTFVFEYDALGRRTAKINLSKGFSPSQGEMSIGQRGLITRFIWDGNVPLHEWQYNLQERPQLIVNDEGILEKDKPEPIENLITWVFDEGSFKPAAKITEEDNYSIITDYLGTPVAMYNSKGEQTWESEYDIYGKIRKLTKGSVKDCPCHLDRLQ